MQISQTNTQLVDAACIKGFVPPPPVLLPDTTMRHESMRRLAAAALTCTGPAWSQAQSRSGTPVPPVVPVCDVLRAPLEYDRRLARIGGRLGGTEEGRWPVGEGVAYRYSLTVPGYRGVLHPPDCKLDEDSARRFNRTYKGPQAST